MQRSRCSPWRFLPDFGRPSGRLFFCRKRAAPVGERFGRAEPLRPPLPVQRGRFPAHGERRRRGAVAGHPRTVSGSASLVVCVRGREGEGRLRDRFTRVALVLALALLAAFVAEPYVARYLYSTQAPRTVAARGDLAPAEKATVELFQRVSPTVVHVFAQPGGGRGLTDPEGESGGVQTGTGFVWDDERPRRHQLPRHPGRRRPPASRSPTRRPYRATLVGAAPNNDLAVLQHRRADEQAAAAHRRRQLGATCRSARPPSPSATRSASTRR